MSNWYESFHFLLRGSHIAVGLIGLLLFWCTILLKKGTSSHRFVGRCFVVTALYVGGTAMISALWALTHLDTFAPWIAQLPESEQTSRRGQYQFLYSILLFLAIATVTGAIYGYHSVRIREDVAALRKTSLPWWQLAAAVSGIYLAIFGGYHFVLGGPVTDMPRSAYCIPLLIGAFGVSETIKEMRQAYRPLTEPRQWLYRHIEQMFGTGVAFHTAFLVFGARTWLAPYLNGQLMFLPWVLPLIVGGIATKWYVDRLRGQPQHEQIILSNSQAISG